MAKLHLVNTYPALILPYLASPLGVSFCGRWSPPRARTTLPVVLALYSQGQNATNYGLLLAGSVLVIAPMVALFMALQRFFVQGVTAGIE